MVQRYFAVRELGLHAQAIPVLVQLAERHDASEWVRQALVRALLDLRRSDGHPDLLPLIDRFLDPGFEPSPRVRAVVASLWARSVLGSDFELAIPRALRWLADPTPLVRRVGLETLRATVLAAIAQGSPAPVESALWRDLIGTLQDRRLNGDADALVPDALEAIQAFLSPAASALIRKLKKDLARVHEGRILEMPVADLDEDLVGRALAVASQDDLDLFAELSRGRLRLRHGAQSRMRLWRVLHEWRNLRADKRRDVSHVTAPTAREMIRAHSTRLACRVPTFYAGERTSTEKEQEWGRHLPTPDDLADLAVLRARPMRVFSSRGVTTISSPPGLLRRLVAHATLSAHFAELCRLRNASVAAAQPSARREYAQALHNLGITLSFRPYDLVWTGDSSSAFDPTAAASIPNAPAAFALISPEAWRALDRSVSDALAYFASPVGNDIGQLAMAVGAATALFLCLSGLSQWQVERDRRKIPLTISGWGTRGKSSLERLKTGMFVGYGFEVLSKTTGSFPSMVYAPPWGEPIEIPLYRPGNRATIWEQRDVLHVAASLGVQVFAWECMAVRPEYAETLQSHWMHDRVTTLTNTYPDHEDLQGPSAMDVTRSLCRVVSHNGLVVTAEDLMLPLVRAEAAQRGASVRAVEPFAHELLPPDLMLLFPYAEHPLNVALLQELARELGLDPDVAVVVAAEHVLPDVGALRRMRPVTVGRHRIAFVNGMSANDAPSALANLQRIPRDPRQTFVVVANARRDRPARTEVFARLLVRDIAAAVRVLTGDDAEAMHRQVLNEAAAWAAELQAHTHAEAHDLLQRVLRVADLRDAEAHPRAASLANAIYGAKPDADWVAQLRGFAVDLLRSTVRVALPTPFAVIATVVEATPPGDVLLFAVQNIGGVGRTLVATFAQAERDQVELHLPPTTSNSRLRHFADTVFWQLRSAVGLLLAPRRRRLARRLLHRFACRRLTATEVRLAMETLMAGEY